MSKPTQAINRYKADLREFHFILFEQFNLGELLGKGPFQAWGEDEVKTSLAECYRWVREVIGPLNAIGDQGCRLEGGRVQTPPGFLQFGSSVQNGLHPLPVSWMPPDAVPGSQPSVPSLMPSPQMVLWHM